MDNSTSKIESIVFGGGCFWCVEAVFQMLRGVVSVTSGYAGGTTENPTYEDVAYSGSTGHAEVIQVEFDPTIVKIDDLLSVFFTSHDPTSLNRQGNDTCPMYRSAVYFTTPEQKITIDQFIQKLTSDHVFPGTIVTEVKPLKAFYPAEQYHQNYYQNNSAQPYCQTMISPKIAKLKANYQHLLK